jgi:hypothetical protein
MTTTKIRGIARKAARTAGLTAFGVALTLGLSTGLAQTASATQLITDDTTKGGMYGDPSAAMPYWRLQTYDDCALMAAADVIGQLHRHEVSEQQIIAVAQELKSPFHPGPIYQLPSDMNDPNSGQGTNPRDIPVLLAHYGIHAKIISADDAARTGGSTDMNALEHYLAGGHKVIVGVNGELIWGRHVENTDKNGNPVADHAVVVTGVDVANGIVHLNDSGTNKGRDETVPIKLFERSWATSNDQMIVTEETS